MMEIFDTIQLMGNLGEFVGAIAVLITLIYLAVQIKQNTTQVNIATLHSILTAESNARLALLDSDLSRILVAVREGGRVSVEELVKIDSFMHAVFSNYEATFLAYQAGTADEQLLKAVDQRIIEWMKLPGWEVRWRYLKKMVTTSFADHVDKLEI